MYYVVSRQWNSRLRTGRETLLVLALAAHAAFGQGDTAADRDKLLTPQASLNLRTISDLQYSPNGKWLGFVVTEPAKGSGRIHHVWVYDTTTGGVRQFTFSAKSESSPRWSPDGKQLAFLSDRGEEQQLYLMGMGAGEGMALNRGKRGIKSFRLVHG